MHLIEIKTIMFHSQNCWQGVLPDELINFECNKMKITKSRIKYNIENKKTILFLYFLKILDDFSFLDVTKKKICKINGVMLIIKKENKLVLGISNDETHKVHFF